MTIPAILLAAAAPAVVPPDPGTTLHYERSNIAGGEEEQILIHRVAATEIAVAKLRQPCTRAALVTATLDPATGEATRLVAARLEPGARSTAYGEMRFDPATATVTATVTMDGREQRDAATVTDRPWHLYDYDLATLIVHLARPGAAAPRRAAFGLALVWPDAASGRFLTWLGRAEIRRVRRERHEGRAAIRYDVSGPAFGSRGGGAMWLEARTHVPIDVQWRRPNHPGYADFRLRLRASHRDGTDGWRRRLAAHFQGCTKTGD